MSKIVMTTLDWYCGDSVDVEKAVTAIVERLKETDPSVKVQNVESKIGDETEDGS